MQLTVLDAQCRPACGEYLNLHSTPTSGAEAGRFQCPGRAACCMRPSRSILAAAVAPHESHRCRHSVADSALTGILRSSSNARSSVAGRPNVVR